MTPLLENILQQSSALEGVCQFHTSKGWQSLLTAADSLNKKSRVIVTGMGASLFAGAGFAHTLGSLGKQAKAVEASELLYFPAPELDSDTALILISRSGESVEITKLVQRARARGAYTLGVTNVPESALARKADQTILTASPPDQFAAIQTYTAAVATLMLLEAAMNNRLERAANELTVATRVLSEWLPELVRSRTEWNAFLDTQKPIYLLGRGSNLGSISEGALLMHEIAKEPIVGMSVAQFRHGPVEVVDADFRAVVLGTETETIELDSALARDLQSMGGTVRWLAPAGAGSGVSPLFRWPSDAPPRFWRVFEIVPLQCLAYRKAELKGIPLGLFLWAPQVTTSESGFGTSPSAS